VIVNHPWLPDKFVTLAVYREYVFRLGRICFQLLPEFEYVSIYRTCMHMTLVAPDLIQDPISRQNFSFESNEECQYIVFFGGHYNWLSGT